MIALSYDPDAGSLYWYFTEITEGSTALEGECDALLLLDDNGQIIGAELTLDESVAEADLALARANPLVAYDRESFTLTIRLFDEEPALAQPLSDVAVLDFDANECLQGFELLPAAEFELEQRLERLAPLLVNLEDDADIDASVAESATERSGDQETERSGDTEDAPSLESPHLPISPSPLLAESHRTGFVALVGRPNVGKSTLLNAILGQKVAIVSPKPQTTRTAIRGMLNRPDAQVVFIDTPGIHEPRNRLGAFMVEQARRSIPDADVVCMVVDIAEAPRKVDERIAAMLRRARTRRILVLNKIDLPAEHGVDHLNAYRALAAWDMEVAVSALRGQGLDALIEEIVRLLPAGPPLYPEDQITDQSEREHVAELVREQVLRLTQQEVPHGVAIEVEEWTEKEKTTYIRLSILVERESQKAILIGAGGSMLKKIGSGARRNIEQALGRPVYLDLWIKTRDHWRDDPNALHWLGYRD